MPSDAELIAYFVQNITGLAMISYVAVSQIRMIAKSNDKTITAVEMSLAVLFIIIAAAHIIPTIALVYELAHIQVPKIIVSLSRIMNLELRMIMDLVIFSMYLSINKRR